MTDSPLANPYAEFSDAELSRALAICVLNSAGWKGPQGIWLNFWEDPSGNDVAESQIPLLNENFAESLDSVQIILTKISSESQLISGVKNTKAMHIISPWKRYLSCLSVVLYERCEGDPVRIAEESVRASARERCEAVALLWEVPRPASLLRPT